MDNPQLIIAVAGFAVCMFCLGMAVGAAFVMHRR